MRQKTVITKLLQSVKEVYYKVRQVLQSVTEVYYRARQVLQSVTEVSYKVRQVLQSASGNTKYHRMLLQSVSGTTQCDRLLLQSASGITKCDRLLLQSASGITECDSYYKVRRNRGSSREKLYQELGSETLQQRRWYRKLCCFYKILKLQSPKYLYSIIPTHNMSYRTRQCNEIPAMNMKHDFFNNSFFSFNNN